MLVWCSCLFKPLRALHMARCGKFVKPMLSIIDSGVWFHRRQMQREMVLGFLLVQHTWIGTLVLIALSCACLWCLFWSFRRCHVGSKAAGIRREIVLLFLLLKPALISTLPLLPLIFACLWCACWNCGRCRVASKPQCTYIAKAPRDVRRRECLELRRLLKKDRRRH